MNTGAISSDTACGLEIEAVLQKYHKKFEITHSVILVDVPYTPEQPTEQVEPLEVVEEIVEAPIEPTDESTTTTLN